MRERPKENESQKKCSRKKSLQAVYLNHLMLIFSPPQSTTLWQHRAQVISPLNQYLSSCIARIIYIGSPNEKLPEDDIAPPSRDLVSENNDAPVDMELYEKLMSTASRKLLYKVSLTCNMFNHFGSFRNVGCKKPIMDDRRNSGFAARVLLAVSES